MTEDWTIETVRVVTEPEQVSPSIKELTLFTGDSVSSASLVVVAGVRDAAGNWREDIAPVVTRFEGEEAAGLIALLLGATVQEGPHAGLTVKEAGKRVIRERIAA